MAFASRNGTSGCGPLACAQTEGRLQVAGWVARRSGRCSNLGQSLGHPCAQLSSDGNGSEVVPASEFGVSEDEGRGQGERDQKNQGHSCEAMVGDRLPLSRDDDLFGAVPASVEKSVFESPMFRQIHPAVVLILPATVPQLADNRSGKYLLGQRGDPKPFVVGGMRSQFSFAVTIASEYLLGAHHPYRFGVVDGEGQTFGIPELNLVCLMVALLGKTDIRWSRGKQAQRRLIQIT